MGGGRHEGDPGATDRRRRSHVHLAAHSPLAARTARSARRGGQGQRGGHHGVVCRSVLSLPPAVLYGSLRDKVGKEGGAPHGLREVNSLKSPTSLKSSLKTYLFEQS